MIYKMVNGVKEPMPQADILQMQAYWAQSEREYWEQPYDILVNAEIRKRYSISQEFALLRQREEKPNEYKEYFDYCESCKTYVKSKIKELN